MQIIRNHGVRVLVIHSIDIYAAFAMCWAFCWVLGETMVQGNKNECSVLTEVIVENRDKVSRQLLSRVINILLEEVWGTNCAYRRYS